MIDGIAFIGRIGNTKFTIKIRGINGIKNISLWSYTYTSYSVYFRRQSTWKKKLENKNLWNFFLPTLMTP